MVYNDCQLLIHKRGEELNMDQLMIKVVLKWYKKFGKQKFAWAIHQNNSKNSII